jgi:hypothetical protein
MMFSRTQNENGTFDTRCLHCFMTVGFSVEMGEELDKVERNHLCPERVLAELLENEKQKAAVSPVAQN